MNKKDLRENLDKLFDDLIKSDEVPSGVLPKNERNIFLECDMLKDLGYKTAFDEKTNSFLFF